MGNVETTQQLANVNDRVQATPGLGHFLPVPSPQLKMLWNTIARETFLKACVSVCVPVHVFVCSKGKTKPTAKGISEGNEPFSGNHSFSSGKWAIYHAELLQSLLQ